MALETIERVDEYDLPFARVDESSLPLRVLDCFFSNYDIPLTLDDVCSIVEKTSDDIEAVLENYLLENIIKRDKLSGEEVFSPNFKSPKTMGLFQYYRAVLDENLEKLAYNKVALK